MSAGNRTTRSRAAQPAAAYHADQAAVQPAAASQPAAALHADKPPTTGAGGETVTAALPLVPSHIRDEVMSAAHQEGDTGAAAVDVNDEEGGAVRGRRVAAARALGRRGAAASRPAKRARTGDRGGSHRNDAQSVDSALEAELDAMEATQLAAWHTSSSDDDDASGGDEHEARSDRLFVTHAEARMTFKKKRIQSSQAETKKLDDLAQVEAAENGRLLPRTLRELAALQAAAETFLQEQAAAAAAASASGKPVPRSRRIAMPPLTFRVLMNELDKNRMSGPGEDESIPVLPVLSARNEADRVTIEMTQTGRQCQRSGLQESVGS